MTVLENLVEKENPDPWRRLDCYRSSGTSQNGEAGVIAYLLRLFPEIPQTCLEVGAGTPNDSQNVFFLWSERNWRALLIDGSDHAARLLAEVAKKRENVKSCQALIAPTGENSLDEIVARMEFPTEIGVLSIDIDGADYRIFENLRTIRPSIALIEFNHEIPPEIDYVDEAGESFLRHSAKALERLGRARGFRAVACVGPNVVLLREDLIDEARAAHLPNLPVEAMFDFEFARRRRFRTQIIRSKTCTSRPAFVRRPSPFEAANAVLYYWFMMARQWIRSGRSGFKRIDARTRAAVRAAKLWI